MKKYILLFLVLLAIKAGAQTNDTTKYFKPVDYGWNYARVKARFAFIPPSDTANNKLGLAVLNSIIYYGNGTYWTAASGSYINNQTGATLAAQTAKFWVSDTIKTSGQIIGQDLTLSGILHGTITAGGSISTSANITASGIITASGQVKGSVLALSTSGYSSILQPTGGTVTAGRTWYLPDSTGNIALLSNVALKTNISDTATMLSNYLRKTGGAMTGNLNIASPGSLMGVGLGTSQYTYIGGTGLSITNNGTYLTTIQATTATGSSKTIYLPDATGTVALTSNLTSYLPLSGGTMTGAINMGSQNITNGGSITGGAASFTTGAFSGQMNVEGQGRFKGWYSSGTGSAVELGVSSNIGNIISYDRTNSRYNELVLSGGDGAGGANTNLTINTSGATFSGSVTATSFIVSSDRRLKNIIRRDGDMIWYVWKNGPDKKLHIGYVAQEVEKYLPDAVTTNADGMKAVNYIEVLVLKIRQLEKRIEQLEKNKK